MRMRLGRARGETSDRPKEAVVNNGSNTKKIVIATDGSAGASVAVEQGVWLAKMLEAKAVFVSVARSPLPILGNPYYQRALTADLAKARAAIDAALPVAEERHVAYEAEILEGSPADAILNVGRTHGAELIVIGSRGRGAVTGAVLGSVSSEVVHRADRPVLVARPGAGVRLGERLRAAV
jgi:nucleotide-binding universal stress UspA family protein